MKYKVGDKVKIREDLEAEEMYGGWTVTSNMVSFGGMIATITQCDNDINVYTLDIGYSLYNWTDEMFEDEELEKIKEVDDNNKQVQVRTVDVGFHLDYCGDRVIENVWQGGWATECKERSVFFTTYDCKNQYTLPLSAIDWIIPHEED